MPGPKNSTSWLLSRQVWSRGYAAAGESPKQNVFSGIAWWFQNGGRKMVEVLHRPNGLLCVQNELDSSLESCSRLAVFLETKL